LVILQAEKSKFLKSRVTPNVVNNLLKIMGNIFCAKRDRNSWQVLDLYGQLKYNGSRVNPIGSETGPIGIVVFISEVDANALLFDPLISENSIIG
jgi:hypothetical protein